MTSISIPAAGVLVVMSLLGVLFCVGIVAAIATSYECPFQTRASAPLHSLWATEASLSLRRSEGVVDLIRALTAYLPAWGSIGICAGDIVDQDRDSPLRDVLNLDSLRIGGEGVGDPRRRLRAKDNPTQI